MGFLEKVKRNRGGQVFALAATLYFTVVQPVKHTFTLVASLPPVMLQTASVAGLSGSAIFGSNNSWAGDDLPMPEDLEHYRSFAEDVGGQTGSSMTDTEDEHAEARQGVFGGDGDRAFEEPNQNMTWDDETTRMEGTFFEQQIRSDEESSEGQAYQSIHGISQDEAFHTRDRDYQDMGDRMTLVDQESEGNYSGAYAALQEDLADGVMCTEEVIEEAVYETNYFTETETCEKHTGEVYVPGECRVERDLIIPAVEGSGFSELLNGSRRVFESSSSHIHDFNAEHTEYISDANVYISNADKIDKFKETAEASLYVNDVHIIYDYLDFMSGMDISGALVEKDNSVRVDIHPVGYSMDEGDGRCDSDSPVLIGYSHYNARAYDSPVPRRPAYNYDYIVVSDRLSCIDGTFRVDRAYHRYDEDTHGSGRIMSQSPSSSDINRNKIGMPNMDSGLSSCSNEGPPRLEEPSARSSTVRTSCYFSDVLPSAEGDARGLLYNSNSKDRGRGSGSQRFNTQIIDANTFYCDLSSCNSSNTHHPIGWSVDAESYVVVSSPAFIEEVSQYPNNCALKTNHSYQRNDGHWVTGLDAYFFDDPDYTPDGISTPQWECLDSASSRQVGELSSSRARANEIGHLVSPLFDDIGGVGNEICYQAEARNIGLDISNQPLCDGVSGLECYDPEYNSASITDIIKRFFGGFAYANDTVAGRLQDANHLCEPLENDSECQIVDSFCLWEDPISGKCIRYDYTYECEREYTELIKPAVTKRTCDTIIPCSDEDGYCSYTDDQSESFTDVAVAMSVTQFAQGDQECFGDDPSSCMIFSGEAMECRSKVQGMYQRESCCDNPSDVGIFEYIGTALAAYRISYVQNMVDGSVAWAWNQTTSAAEWAWGGVTGAWESLATDPSNFEFVQLDHFTNSTGSIAQQAGEDLATDMGTSGSEAGMIGSTLNLVNHWTAKYTNQFVSLLSESLGEFLFDEVLRDEVTNEILTGEALARARDQGTGYASYAMSDAFLSGINFAMAAYQVYAVSRMIHSLIVSCSESEMEAAFLRDVGSCIQVGDKVCTSYIGSGSVKYCVEEVREMCCYTSPIARIIHEQAMDTGQHPFSGDQSTYRDLGCRGFWFSEFQHLYFSEDDPDGISLAEWIDLLIGADKLPQPGNEEEFFSEENVTNRTADVIDEDHEVPLPSERASNLVDGMDDMEEIRRQQRETLIAEDQYSSNWRQCADRHNIQAGITQEGRERVSGFAGDQEVIVQGCEPDPEGETYLHQIEQCDEVVVREPDPNCNPDNEECGTVVVDRYTPVTIFYEDKEGVRHDLKVCSADEDLMAMSGTASDEWRQCEPDHRRSLQRSYERFERVITRDDGTEEILSHCQVRPESRSFPHEERICDFSHAATGDSDDGFSYEKREVIVDMDGDEFAVQPCKQRHNAHRFDHEYKFCGWDHQVANDQSIELLEVGFYERERNEWIVADSCEERSASRILDHQTAHCGYDHQVGNMRSIEQRRRYIVDNGEEVQVASCGVDPTSETLSHFREGCGTYAHDDDDEVSRERQRQLVELLDGSIEEVSSCRVRGTSPEISHYFEGCGTYAHDEDAEVSRERQRQLVDLPDGITEEVSSCRVRETSPEISHFFEGCGIYSNDLDAGVSREYVQQMVTLPNEGDFAVLGCHINDSSPEIALDIQTESCGEFEHNLSGGYSTELVREVMHLPDGSLENLNSCSVNSDSPVFNHEYEMCGIGGGWNVYFEYEGWFIDSEGNQHIVFPCNRNPPFN